jgi:hypothetical protein
LNQDWTKYIAVFIWFIGATFWAGATYNSLQAVEVHLVSIDKKLELLDEIKLI